MAHSGDLAFHCNALLNDNFEDVPLKYLDEWKKNLPEDDAHLFSSIIKIALELPPLKRIDASDIAKEFEVAESTVRRWAEAPTSSKKRAGLPHPKIRALIAKWLIEQEKLYYHAFRFKGKWYLSPRRCSQKEARELTIPGINLSDDDTERGAAYSCMGRSQKFAQKRFKDKQEREDAEAMQKAFTPTEISVDGSLKPVTHVWRIVSERAFTVYEDRLSWPKLHEDVRPRSFPRLYANREDAEFLCEPVARRSALEDDSPDPDGGFRIVKEETRTIYFCTDSAGDDYALGWIERVELVG